MSSSIFLGITFQSKYSKNVAVPFVRTWKSITLKNKYFRTRGQGSPSKVITNKLKSNLKHEVLKEDNEEVYYADKFRRLIQKIIEVYHDDNGIEVNTLKRFSYSLRSFLNLLKKPNI